MASKRGASEDLILIARVKTQVQLGERLLERLQQRASATGRDRDQLIEDALRLKFDDDDLWDLLAAVRERIDLTDDSAAGRDRPEAAFLPLVGGDAL